MDRDNLTTTMENHRTPDETGEKKSSFRNYLTLGEVGKYFFRKKDPNRPVNVNIKIMHGINKISIIGFLLAVIYLIAKRFIH
jgi:hypothetical protein